MTCIFAGDLRAPVRVRTSPRRAAAYSHGHGCIAPAPGSIMTGYIATAVLAIAAAAVTTATLVAHPGMADAQVTLAAQR